MERAVEQTVEYLFVRGAAYALVQLGDRRRLSQEVFIKYPARPFPKVDPFAVANGILLGEFLYFPAGALSIPPMQ